ncbi:IucA/IucC family siderophore biosynthesis protein [Paenibacillus sp. PR3]|uniref:IucA/IucC family siderophore biosynthesis protein n=2 Tax=Paenibacillus terricola TaxID=2763503 RepID=A0ABR8MTG5_9BACL|nr:IucA/IucC family siderophore biosynthesis protein [Paenibacillus terricola]
MLLDDVMERIMRQTLEALLFEGIISAAEEGLTWTFEGRASNEDTIRYTCKAQRKASFGRVKVEKHSIRREDKPSVDLYRFVEEVIVNRLNGAYVPQFVSELFETLAKDHQSKLHEAERIPIADRHYDALESYMAEGHPYHPSYKSRLGFSLMDNFAYGPEFNQKIALQWIAVHEWLIDVSVSRGVTSEELYADHLTDEDRQTFKDILTISGCEAEHYVFMPVHPWQMEDRIPTLFVEQLANKDIIVLGGSRSSYRAQQSIRTLSRRDKQDASYIKLALSITNTSTSRILAHHTTQNAPLISDWLQRIIRNDSLLTKLRFQVLRETMGLSLRYQNLSSIAYGSAYGTLGAIFRENVSLHLDSNETAWPLNAVTLTQQNGESFIQSAIDQHGIERWSDALIRSVVLPIIHLLYAHGIALESHAQNIILVLENELPMRIIVKDLHDSVRYVPSQLLHPEWAPVLNPEPETHRKFNRYSFLQTDQVSEVRDYTYDAFFFICMTELCFTLEKCGLGEQQFWSKCSDTILRYQQEHPQYQERFELFDLFSGDGRIEEMTKRRIYGDSELYFRTAPNPLRLAAGVTR